MGGRILKRNLVVYERRGSGERLSLAYLQTEREMRRVRTSCVSTGVTSRNAAVVTAGIET
jgi:hypothetical protein